MGEQADFRQSSFDAICFQIESKTGYKVSDYDEISNELYSMIIGSYEVDDNLEEIFIKKIKNKRKNQKRLLAKNIYEVYLKPYIDLHDKPNNTIEFNINYTKLNYKNTEDFLHDLKGLEKSKLISIKKSDYEISTDNLFYSNGAQDNNVIISIEKNFYNYIK